MRKTKIFAFVVLIITLLCFNTNVKAASEKLTFTPEASTKSLSEGQTITITLKLSDINMGADGINTFGGILVYDENIFEKVTNSSFTTQNNWSIAYNDEETNKKGTFLATNMTGVTTNQTIGTLTLKVKTNIRSTTTVIKFTDVSSVGTDTVNLADELITVGITGTVIDEPKENETKDEKVENETSESNTKKEEKKTSKKKTQAKKDNTTSNKKIPYTGIRNTVLIISGVALVVTAIVVYNKSKKYKI
ncbi:MAG: hypothetical protein HFJ17_01440 [Clostridia bacterium]|nr:hypothetical protein [Clostridia bacterium]